MTGIVKNWNGHVFGTNTGNVAVALDGEDAALNGVIRLSDDKHGVAVYEVAGQFADGSLELAGTPQVAAEAEDSELGNLTVTGSLASDRSDERRGGTECVSTCRYWWSRYHKTT